MDERRVPQRRSETKREFFSDPARLCLDPTLNVEPLHVRSAGGLSLSTTQCLPAANVAKVPKINAASGGTLGCDVNVWEKPAAPLRTTVPRALAGECFNDELRQIAAPAAPSDDARA